jgi:hypothetical protein
MQQDFMERGFGSMLIEALCLLLLTSELHLLKSPSIKARQLSKQVPSPD